MYASMYEYMYVSRHVYMYVAAKNVTAIICSSAKAQLNVAATQRAFAYAKQLRQQGVEGIKTSYKKGAAFTKQHLLKPATTTTPTLPPCRTRATANTQQRH